MSVNVPRTGRSARTVAAAALVAGSLGFAGWWAASARAESPVPAAPVVAAQSQPAAAPAGRYAVTSYADAVARVAPGVVTVRVEKKAGVEPTGMPDDLLRRFFGQDAPSQDRQPREHGLGSGVIVSSDGHVLTNAHVVDGADKVRVLLHDGREFDGKVIGVDKASDLAVLDIKATNLPIVPLADSNKARVGDVVLAVGNPLGVGETVTMGILSAKGRTTSVGDGSYEDFLQTDAPINHGNSGGALVNTRGELVGINSQILSNSDGNIGIGFAIPANMAKNVMEQLRFKGKVTRAQLGVTVQQVTADMAQNLGLKETGGAIISSVTPGSAAERAGLKQGDVIESFNGQKLHDFNTLRNRVAEAGPGSTADVVVIRDGAQKHVSVKLDEANPEKSARRGDRAESDGTDDRAALGISVAPLTPELAERLGAPKGAHGVVVQDVNADGRAADAGIRAGDVIESVNRQPVKGIDDLRAALKRDSDKPTLLLINRQDAKRFVTVRPANG